MQPPVHKAGPPVCGGVGGVVRAVVSEGDASTGCASDAAHADWAGDEASGGKPALPGTTWPVCCGPAIHRVLQRLLCGAPHGMRDRSDGGSSGNSSGGSAGMYVGRCDRAHNRLEGSRRARGATCARTVRGGLGAVGRLGVWFWIGVLTGAKSLRYCRAARKPPPRSICRRYGFTRTPYRAWAT
eukprot:2356081-Prymnesium_polylepis.1